MGKPWKRPPARLAAKLAGGIPLADRVRWLAGVSDDQAKIITFVFDRSRIAPNGCWEWQLATSGPHGYGQTGLRLMGNQRPHRLVPMALGWEIEGLLICHHCDNKRCVRPDHLFVGTYADNMHDCVQKGRFKNPPKTPWPQIMKERPHHWQKITLEQAREIKARLAAGEPRKSLALELGVGREIVAKIARGERWAHA